MIFSSVIQKTRQLPCALGVWRFKPLLSSEKNYQNICLDTHNSSANSCLNWLSSMPLTCLLLFFNEAVYAVDQLCYQEDRISTFKSCQLRWQLKQFFWLSILVLLQTKQDSTIIHGYFMHAVMRMINLTLSQCIAKEKHHSAGSCLLWQQGRLGTPQSP